MTAKAALQPVADLHQVDRVATVQHQQKQLVKENALPVLLIEPKRFKSDAGDRVGFVASKDLPANEVLLEVPESMAITSVDAEAHELIGPVAAGCSELIALTLWLMVERARGGASQWSGLLQTLPEMTLSPVLWEDKERELLLQGSPVLEEARQREQVLRGQWKELNEKWFSRDNNKFSAAVFNESNFLHAFSVVVAHSLYLPSAECFALLPLASLMGRTGNSNGCTLDYDQEKKAVVVTATRPYREGQEVLLNDGRPNGELLLATGTLQEGNLSDYLLFGASLLATDKYFTLKQQILSQAGFDANESFPVYEDRFPTQLLSYLRLTRVADPGLLAKVSFDKDIVVSQMNEYEVLQILMGDCRERLAAYKTSREEDVKLLQVPQELGPKEKLAGRLRLAEKTILSETMDAVRQRLAPIRGIPTKQGMTDPNQDIKDVFNFIEDLPKQPKKLLDGFIGWARGDFDPDWKKPNKK